MDESKSVLNLDELQKKYIKPDYKLEIIKHNPNDKDIIIKILVNNKYETNPINAVLSFIVYKNSGIFFFFSSLFIIHYINEI